MSDLAFWILATVLVAAAIAVVTARSLYRAAYALAAVLAATALFYLLLGAPLLAAVQLLLYTGGVLTLIVFAILMTDDPARPVASRRPVPALAVAAFVFLALAALGRGSERPAPATALDRSAELGTALFTTYLVPFELLSLLLLAALFGALVVARKDDAA